MQIRVVSVLKGTMEQKSLTLILQNRGVKDFDPELNPDDTGVFFLRDVQDTRAKLAYWGSIAIFQKPNFE